MKNVDTAKQFLTSLDPSARNFCFQTFDDLKTRRDPKLARTLHGGLDQLYDELRDLNAGGAGVFVTVNVIKAGSRRKIDNLECIRGVWQDDDTG